MRPFRITAFALALGLAGCQSVEPITLQPGASEARIYPGIDGYGRAITTSSAEAQRYFDQGIQLVYAFNHDEAVRSFREAAAHDPDAPMPWWGIAYANGMNINDPALNEERWRISWEAAQQAKLRIDNASPVEQALIEAVVRRCAWPPPKNQRPYDEAYARAMQRAYTRFPDDADVATFYAESLMNLQPWNYWTPDGEPKGRILDAVAALERALEVDPEHPGANHFYIHAVEASSDPDRALVSADRLTDAMPGAGHLVHMPSHIYVRTGRYRQAAESNQDAIAADRAYFAIAPEPRIYAMYYGHNLHFLSYASMMECNYGTAIRAAQDLAAETPEQFLKDYAFLVEGIMPSTYHVMIRFGKWDEILEQPRPEAEHLRISRVIHHYARGIALSALGRTDEARREVEAFESAAAEVPPDWLVMNNKASDVIPIARDMLWGELLFREGWREEAFAHLRNAVAREDALVYDEPPAWMLPVRHALGALLMSDGRYEEAEAVYRRDLQKNRGNGWALLGLQKSLEAQGRTREAQELTTKIDVAWARADTQPTSSCMCEPGA